MSQGILIADDSSAIRRVIHNCLAERNFHVCGEAVDGEDAIEKTRELKPDLIVLDLAMPRVNGIVVASVLKEMMPSVRIVLFTMYCEAVRKTFTSLNGVDAMVDKADGMGKLVECVRQLLSTSGKLPRDQLTEQSRLFPSSHEITERRAEGCWVPVVHRRAR